jgi:hypothetical protein
MKLSSLSKASLLLCLSASTVLSPTLAQTGQADSNSQLSSVVSAGQTITQSGADSQRKVNQLNDQKLTKLQKFNTVTKELDGLHVYNQQMQSQLDSQISEISQLALSMEQVSIIERQISPLMARMIATLEEFVALDVPFLEVERSKRIKDLKDMMIRADIAVSEKFRRVLEAYQVEVDYGRTIEAYSGLLTVSGQETDVDFLRVGRVSLVYQTRDGSHLGQWQQDKIQLKTLSQDYRLGINKALRIARKQLAPDLMLIPLSSSMSSTSEAE